MIDGIKIVEIVEIKELVANLSLNADKDELKLLISNDWVFPNKKM
jgi:hypothetical protein